MILSAIAASVLTWTTPTDATQPTRHAEDSDAAGAGSTITLVKPAGHDHDQAALATPAQEILAQAWSAR